jgi:ABC-type Zn uptake system ZnuABC Zn-binding protein ZnuA
MMNKKMFAILAVIVLAAVGTIFILRSAKLYSGNKVAATIFPLYDIVKNIAGESLDVVLVLPPGASPHTYDPSPSEVRAIAGSRAMFAIGHGLDNWSQLLTRSADINKIVIVDRNIALIEGGHDHDHHDNDPHQDQDHEEAKPEDDDHDEEHGKDPHYWLSVANAILIAAQVKDELAELFPEYSQEFEENYKVYQQKLSGLKEQIDTDFKNLPDNRIATFHNAWAYFAKDHNLNIIATFEEYPGQEPSVNYLREFQNKLRKEKIRVIFSEPQFATKSLEPIANDLGVTISVIDPIGGVEGKGSYMQLMRYNADKILEALQ